ncbi:MAG: hypothetical protein C4519_14690 [Desulfobacteraceae bacterium]|nr:MAG: hypothetical protein C4519_14690 [Desulfobacteraceae bacterium]
MLARLKQSLRSTYRNFKLPPAAKAEMRSDTSGLPAGDPGNERVVAAAMAWMKTAQDSSRSNDGGIARFYSMINGWSSSYPETTGYIIPTILKHASGKKDLELRGRGLKMLDWLVDIQLPEGGFQGGLIDARPKVPVTFNTGSVLLGLAAGAIEFGHAYLAAMTRAAQWLQATQDEDGCWRKYPSPFAKSGEKVQDVHVAWGLLEAERVTPNRGYADAALKNVRWAISHQASNGWFSKIGVTAQQPVVSHALGFVLRGLIEAYGHCGEKEILAAGRRTADGLLQALRADGFLPGLMHGDWRAAADWNCLVGSAQIACCWLMLYKYTADEKYRRAALAVNRYIRRSVKIEAAEELTGAIKGSFPVHGGYMPFTFLSPKFLIDAIDLEREV